VYRSADRPFLPLSPLPFWRAGVGNTSAAKVRGNFKNRLKCQVFFFITLSIWKGYTTLGDSFLLDKETWPSG